MSKPSAFSRLAIAVALLVALPSVAGAQYFGQNKVQYKTFDFQVMKTDHFDIYFYPSERDGIDIAARMAERWNTRLERIFEHQLKGRQPLILYASHPDFEQTNAIQGTLGEGTGGVTEPIRRRIVLPMGGPLADTDHVIGHELVHAFQFDITTRPGAAAGENGAEMLPLWFIEGMAEYLSLGPVDSNTAMWLRDAVHQENDKHPLPDLNKLNDPTYFPYRWGQAFWAYVGGKWGDSVIGEMLRLAGASGDIDLTIRRVLGVSSKELSDEWHDAMRQAYGSTTGTTEPGRLVIKGKGMGNELNVGPSVSPNGQLIALISGRGLFSVDLYVADAETGRTIRKLTSTSTDPHYSSIQFIYSAGAWDSESKRIVIATVTGGKSALTIFDALSGHEDREVKVPEVDEIFNPTWAPDGHAVAFTGLARGLTDLYVYDLEKSQLKQLTNDPFADIQPAWSPDGKWIAFATDRFSSQLDTLNIGQYRLALIDPTSGQVQQIRAFTTGKSINPQWAPDSSALYYLSDRDGISNLYRVSLAQGEVKQMTKVDTGISGITGTSPAMSIAAKSGLATFTVYHEGGYDLYAEKFEGLTTGDTSLTPASQIAATLPPLDRRASDVAALLANPTLGLPAPQEAEVEKYKPKLGLEAVGQPTISVGADRFGAAIGGGIFFYFTDLLGDHALGTAVQFQSSISGNFSIRDTAAQVTYLDKARRWNWGLSGGQVPYVSGGVQASVDDTQTLYTQDTIVYRQTERSASGLVAYPFNRAQRVEFQGGMSQIFFDQIVRRQIVDIPSNTLIYDETTTIPYGDTLNMFSSSMAVVYDTTSYGPTSPVQGQRYRLEVAPTIGSVDFASALIDYRHYFMPVPFYTIATRVLHYGRYGPGGEDPRLVPLYIGYPTLVRGYDVNTFNSNDCISGTCSTFDQLQGSRVLVGNVELRFPLLRPFGIRPNMYGPVPVEVALFADSGVAWNRGQTPTIFGGGRDGVASVGSSLRVNLFGFFVGQFDWAKPIHRENRGWVFQFSFSPGF